MSKKKKTRKEVATPPKAQTSKPKQKWVLIAVLMSVLFLLVRFYASKSIGFGDSEALYACYALHPQASYLDHPGAIGVFARTIGGGFPTPFGTHLVTAALATMAPWILALVARSLPRHKDVTTDDMQNAATASAIVAGTTPVLAIGLFALTPDLLLFFAWLATIGLACVALDAKPSSSWAVAAFLGAGLCAGIAGSSKVTGLLLLVVLAAIYSRKHARPHARTAWPWLGLAVSALPISSFIAFEADRGWPMLVHRLVTTQKGSGLSLRNIGMLFGGQLVYLSPVICVLAVMAARDLIRRRNEDGTTNVLFWAFAIPIVPLALFSLWSCAAEPHWIAPALLVLPIHAVRTGVFAARRKLVIAGAGVAFAMTAAVHAWILSPSLLRFAPQSYDPRVDITNELLGWRDTGDAIIEMANDDPLADTWIVGPNWMECAQIHAAIPRAKVGCASDVRTDFDDWFPRETWKNADRILFVTDNRWDENGHTQFMPRYTPSRRQRLTVLRGGRVIRTFTITLLERRAAG